jgi:glycine/D-amino acid oxidase-like deaminating enzyme
VLCAPLEVKLPVASSPTFLMRVAAAPRLVRTILASPEFEVRENRDGELLMTAPFDEEVASAPTLEQLAQHALERLQSSFGGSGSLRLLGHGVARRRMPAGGPIVGYLTPDKSVYVAVMHTALTLAPTVGRLVANELVSGEPAAELRRCRPQRLSTE